MRLTTDNGRLFTSTRYIEILNRVRIIHRRTACDPPEGNSYIERFYRSLKEEKVRPLGYYSVEQPRASIARWV